MTTNVSESRDPMGLILAAARPVPTLMNAARQVDAELLAARAALDEIEALANVMGDGVNPECSAYADELLTIIRRAKGSTDE